MWEYECGSLRMNFKLHKCIFCTAHLNTSHTDLSHYSHSCEIFLFLESSIWYMRRWQKRERERKGEDERSSFHFGQSQFIDNPDSGQNERFTFHSCSLLVTSSYIKHLRRAIVSLICQWERTGETGQFQWRESLRGGSQFCSRKAKSAAHLTVARWERQKEGINV